jgi:hypothetical protein
MSIVFVFAVGLIAAAVIAAVTAPLTLLIERHADKLVPAKAGSKQRTQERSPWVATLWLEHQHGNAGYWQAIGVALAVLLVGALAKWLL